MSSPIVAPITAQGIDSSAFNVGSVVAVRCVVNSITGKGSGALVNVTVETPGNAGQIPGVTFNVSPVQCRRDTSASVLSGS